MADACRREEWERQSEMMALTANVNRPRGKSAYRGSDFNPLRKRKRGFAVSGKMLQAIYCRKQKKK